MTHVLTHGLSFAMRFTNHFTGLPVSDELPVRLNTSFTYPVKDRNGRYRQADGSYRFINLDLGIHEVLWRPPLKLNYRGWTSFDADPMVTLPLPNPASLITTELWPHPSAAVQSGITAIRGRLLGSGIDRLQVRVFDPTSPSAHFTYTDRSGDFLFLLTLPLTPNSAGLVELQIEVEGGARAVTGGSFLPDSAGSDFVSDQFLIRPSETSRVNFNVS